MWFKRNTLIFCCSLSGQEQGTGRKNRTGRVEFNRRTAFQDLAVRKTGDSISRFSSEKAEEQGGQ